jgi:hypothetical protein
MVSLLPVFLIATAQMSMADDQSLRIPRPSASFVFHETFTIKRVPDGDLFTRWRRDYCCPSVCAMVLCHGACAETASHCPSFAEGNNLLNRLAACSSPDACQTMAAREHDCCVKK